MTVIEPQAIPQWLRQEAEEYFIPLPFAPKSILDIGANIGAFAQRAHQEWPELALFVASRCPLMFLVCGEMLTPTW